MKWHPFSHSGTENFACARYEGDMEKESYWLDIEIETGYDFDIWWAVTSTVQREEFWISKWEIGIPYMVA